MDGITGAHYHKNWENANFRKVVLNAILWIAKVEVPPNGVECTVTSEDLKQNLDDKGQRNPGGLTPPRIEPFVGPRTGK